MNFTNPSKPPPAACAASWPPMRLYEKAKRLGVWNPADIDLTQDKLDWQRLTRMRRTS